MSKAKYEKPFHLDMPFGEALGRYAQTDSSEVEPSKKSKEKKVKAALLASPPTHQHKQPTD